MTSTEIDSLRDAAIAVAKDPRCRDLIAATAQGEFAARSVPTRGRLRRWSGGHMAGLRVSCSRR